MMFLQKFFIGLTFFSTLFPTKNLIPQTYSWEQSCQDYPALSDPKIVNYNIDVSMVTTKSFSFSDWFSIPWNSGYFDVDQADTKISHASFAIDAQKYLSTVVTGKSSFITQNFSYDFPSTEQPLNFEFPETDFPVFENVFFNHNFIPQPQTDNNSISIVRDSPQSLRPFKFEIDIQKPLSFYIQSFMFSIINFRELFAHHSFFVTFSMLDYDNTTLYRFVVDLKQFPDIQNPTYFFISLPVRVPNLKQVSVEFDVSVITHDIFSFGQFNIFSDQQIQPTPPVLPFSPEYERAPWYDFFAQGRNLFRWLIFGVVGQFLPIDKLSTFLNGINILLTRFLHDTLGVFIPADFLTIFETCVGIWLFIKFMRFAI